MNRKTNFRKYYFWLLISLGYLTPVFGCSDWTEVTTERFHLYANLPPDKAIEIANNLNIFEAAIEVVTNARGSKAIAPTKVVVIDGVEWGSFIGTHINGLFKDGSFENTILVVEPDYRAKHPYSIVMHEYVHFLLHSQGGFTYPRWYDEGLAEVLSASNEDAKNFQLGLLWKDRMHDANGVINERSVRSIFSEPLSKKDFRNPNHMSEFYGESTLLAHYLLFSSQRKNQLVSYLKAINDGKSADDAFANSFDISYAELAKELQTYSRLPDFPGYVLPKTMLAPREPPTAEKISCSTGMVIAGQALLVVGASPMDVSGRFFRDYDDVPTPTLQLARAEALLNAKKPEKANELIDEALKSPTITGLEMINAAKLLLGQINDAQPNALSQDERSRLEKIRQLIRNPKVRELKMPEAAFIFGRVSLLLGSDLDDALETAFQGLDRVPKNPYLAETTALLCEQKNDMGNAAAAWAIVASYATNDAARLRAREILKEIDNLERAKHIKNN